MPLQALFRTGLFVLLFVREGMARGEPLVRFSVVPAPPLSLSYQAPSQDVVYEGPEAPDSWLQEEQFSVSHFLQQFFAQFEFIPSPVMSETPEAPLACVDLQVEPVKTVLPRHNGIIPAWLEDATLTGECPWRLARRQLPAGMIPPSVLEVECLCKGQRCFHGGDFRCTPVVREVTIWMEDALDREVSSVDRMRLTVGCVCAQRRGGRAGQVEHAILT